ncbi:ATP-dependent helicase HrpB [Breznakibacter xylanolyticus]|uniref:ATP-dependent helicase HrpB n=1 Tax=Breznakibacter xylanolyticus TaxID=990 RepID=A0A2W7NIR1_9BACT|nr:ATP-dependent helicase HrpB [Breznakibacter xylanolyticus]PZX20341.1 ATP-dependent helicase HrpB [Breznakibacter xylanolyticus]
MLPIQDIIPDVKAKLAEGNTLIVSAPPGAGKSTLLPLALMNEPWLEGQKIIMLEPRRLAARSIATRLSQLNGSEVGHAIGYRIRFENKTSQHTRLEVVTEGILTRMLQSDNALEGVGLVIFDEFHERSIHADVALALCREAQQVLRPDLRMVVMSATLNMPQLSSLLSAPVVESQGRQYPVEVHYGTRGDEWMIPETTARAVVEASQKHGGDILVFLPGEGEIRKCEEMLKKQLHHFAIHPLYGQLPPSKQQSAIMPNRDGKRKVVLATSIAETSLTIEGISVVVDCGYGRTLRFDTRSGLSRLTTIEISKDSADQRAGRAGRLGPGVCYRLWSMADHHRLADHRTPEILESDLSSLVLDMVQWGVTDVNRLAWLTPPPKSALSQASELLHEIDALQNHKITEHGKQLHRLPCHPRIAHMLLLAQKDGLLPLATDVAAILEERDPLPRDAGIDINLRVEALRRYRLQNRNDVLWSRIERVAASYRQMFDVEPQNVAVNPFETGLVLVHAYPERIACARPGNNVRFQLSNGAMAVAGHHDDLAHEPWLVVANLDARDGLGKIFLAAPVNPTDLAPLLKERQTVTWDTRKGGFIATRDLRIGNLVLQSKPLEKVDDALKVQAICQALQKEGGNLLDFNEETEQWQNRVLCLRVWRPDELWPDVSTPALLQRVDEWLAPYLSQVRRPDDLKKIDLGQVLHNHLPWEKQSRLNELAPARIDVPSGSKIKLQYSANGSAPVLVVRLQEVFGLAQTPSVNEGRTPVLMHLLSPGYKPVQVTSDLNSFWNNTYFEVKKELRTRYPKHVWPDDPWTEKAIRGVKRK